MILHPRDGSGLEPKRSVPWSSVATRDLAFCSIWATGNDTAMDGIVRLVALRPIGITGARTETWERFDRMCRPFPAPRDEWPGESAAERAFGLSRADLESAPPAATAWGELLEFLSDRPVVVADAEVFEAWRAHFAAESEAQPSAIGVAEMSALLFPGRSASAVVASTALDPAELRTLLRDTARRFLGREEDALRLAATGYLRAWEALVVAHPRAGERLLLALALLDRPSEWMTDTEDGLLAGRLDRDASAADLLDPIEPRCMSEAREWEGLESLPPDSENPVPFDPVDRGVLAAVFRTHLPARFAADGGASAPPSYRAGQHAVAGAVADALGSGELLLVHAPTGTGKTLAYLVPAMLWSLRHEVRVGVATYTRALQEQAMSREVPRALEALARAGVATAPRVCALKGRENYLCWRAFKSATPDEDDDGETWLAWTTLALFALSDADGDLDRLPLRPPLPLESSSRYREALASLLRQSRGRTACCTNRDERESCAAEVARRRAERSHVVITNQAFALARQEYFKHLVFDECEHLHDQAHAAWSHTLPFREIRATLARVRQPGRRGSRASLDRLARALLEGTPSHAAVLATAAAWEEAARSVDALEASVEAFIEWREEERRSRDERDEHSLLREYVVARDTGDLVEGRRTFARTWNDLDAALAELAERLDAMPLRGLSRVRRAFDLARLEIAAILAAVEAWIPLDEGKPSFRPSTFYDVERDARGDTVLAARVLLPNEFLGRNYHPQLASGVFLSATTWLQRSFEPALGYLGLDRAAKPAEDEDRPPRVVRTFRAPDVFDYARVLVAVPRDAPPVAADKRTFLAYVRRFVAHLGERTRGRMLVLFTNAQDAVDVGEELQGFFRARRIPLWFQNMEGAAKEELSDLFRARVDSVLLGVDTFWYGADFPGETLEHLVIVRLPYGVPDRYHHAQCAALGAAEQRRRIYMPRALAKFRQGFGRLMRKESDRGCVYVLDGRVLEPRHRAFLKELPIAGFESDTDESESRARFVRGETDRCVREALAHMELTLEVQRRGLDWSFSAAASS